MLCTMPRRLAATAAAQRLADTHQPPVEVGGAEVGFHVGADKRCTEQTRLVFATAGVLVEMLRAGGEGGLDRFAALIVDEVHERSVENDLSLALVRQLMLKRSRLRLILMSATFNLPRYEAFLGAKLGGVARVNIPDAQPGSMEIFHRCSTEYLEGVLRLPSLDGHSDVTRLSETSNGQPGNIHLEPTLHLLIRDLVLHCHNQVCRSAAEIILVFLPTFRSLEHQFDLLQMSGAALNVRALHSAIDLETSALTMLTGGEGRRKVILATNVAESSVTIPGVTCVIDSCRTLQVVWSRLAQKDVPTIAWISKSQADQRKGRTGRTCAGTVYRLVPRSRYDSFATYEPPAVRMQSLREPTLVLSCSASSSMSDPMSLFATCLDPPDRTVVSDALTYLAHIDAIEVASNGRARPTFLGRLLTSMPLALTAARLAVLGGREGFMRDAAALASVLDKSPLPIIQPFGDQLSCVANLQMYFTQAKQSDRVSVLLANLAAFEFWQHAQRDPARLAALCAHARLAPDAAPVASALDVAAEEVFCMAHRLSLTALLQVEQTLNAIVNAFHRWRPAFLDDVALPACAVTQMDHACSPGGLCALSVPQFTDAFPGSMGSELEAILCAIVEEDVEPVLAEPVNYSPYRPTVCLFYNKPGGCTRTGCTFLHAAGPLPPCRFYGTKQGCTFGARCTFFTTLLRHPWACRCRPEPCACAPRTWLLHPSRPLRRR